MRHNSYFGTCFAASENLVERRARAYVPYKPTGDKAGRPKNLQAKGREAGRVFNMPRPRLSDQQWAALQIELIHVRSWSKRWCVPLRRIAKVVGVSPETVRLWRMKQAYQQGL